MKPDEAVRSYLAAMERRDLAGARDHLAPGFHMVFPGGRRFDSLEALVEFAKSRYRSARKVYDRFDVAGDVVYCSGTLYGERLDGSKYEGIRFIDRFTVRAGKLVDQQVWNDMGESLNGEKK